MKAIEQYFNYLKDAGADVPSTVDSFKKTLSDKSAAEQYYGYLKQNNFDAPESFDSFAKTLGLNKPATVPVKKKDGSDPLSLDTPSVSGLNPEDPIPSISALLKQRKKLKAEKDAPKPTSAPGFPLATVETAPVIDYDAQISKIDEQIKAKGFDPDELDLKFGEYDIDVDDNKFKELYTNYNEKPFATTRQFNATTWHQAVRGVQSKNPDEQLKQKNLGELQKLIADGDSLPTYDLNTAINFGRNAYQQIIALTAGDGEARDKAIENFKKDYSPVLAQIALRDKNFSSQTNLPLQIGLLYEDIFDKSKADQTRSILSQDLSGNPDAASGRDRRKYEIEEEGLSIIQSGVGEEIEGGYDKIKTWVDWQKNNIGKLSELGQKISTANPEVRATIDAANKEIASINKSVESSPLNLELKNQGEIVKQFENDYKAGVIGRDIYAAEVDKYNALAEQYNNERAQAKYKADQIVKVANEKAASSGVSPDELKEYNRLIGEYELLANERGEADKASGWMTYFDKEKNKIVKNNPTVLADKVIMQMQEWDGENANPAERLILGFGSLVPKAKDAFEIIYDSFALPPDKKTEKDFERLGRSTSDQLLLFYEKEKDKLFQSPVITVVPDSIKKIMSEIDANNNLNDAEQEQAKKDVLRNGFISGQIYQTTNPNAGKINITGKSIINSAVTVVPQILTAAGMAYITGGAGTGVAVSTFLNGYSSYYNDGVNKGLANPNQYAFAHSLVDYATEMIGTNDLKLIQSAFKGSKGVGAKFFKDLTDGEFKSLLAGSRNAFKNTGKAIVKNTGINVGEAVEEGLAAGGGNIVDQELFGKKTPVTQGVTESVLTTFLGQLPLTLLGIPVSVNRNNIASKYALYDAATDVNGTMAFLKKELDAGNLTSQEYTDRVKLVNDYAKAIKETPATYADGNPMRDDDKAKYAFNQFISNMKADKSPLPPQQKQSIDQVIADAENENDKILSNATNQSQVQEGRTEGDLGQPQGIVQGQPEVGQGAGSQGQAEVTTANVGDSNISGQGQVGESKTQINVEDLPTANRPSLRGSIDTPSGVGGYFNASTLPDGTAYIADIQIGFDENAPRGRGYGLDAYIQIGKKLKELGYTLESTQWDKHTSGISPQALRVWEKLSQLGYARIIGQKQNKVYNRETGAEEVRSTNVYEFTEPTTKEFAPELSNIESFTIDRPSIVSNTSTEVDRLKAAELGPGDGVTLNMDGTKYEGGGLVVPIASINTTQEELTPELIANFAEENKGKLSSGQTFKFGLYKFPDSNQVSIDLNIVTDPKNRDIALEFGRKAGQESLFDLSDFSNVQTGADGQNPVSFSDDQIREIGKAFEDGRMPNVFGENTADELSKELGRPIDKALAEAIPMVEKSLQEAGIKIQVVDAATDTEQARAARGNQGLFRSEDGTVIIDKSKLANEIESGLVVWHEASHPVMNIIRNTDKPLYDAVVRGLKQAAKKNKGVAGALNWAQSQEQYDNEDTQNDESVVETIGRINAGLIDINSLDTGLRQKLIDFINSIAKYFGIDPILNDRDIAAFKKTVSEVADALKAGRNIGEIVGQENVKNYGVPIGVPTQAKVADKYGPKVKHDGGTYKLSFVKPSDIIDIKGLIKEIADSGQKVWFWTADQLGRGMYYDNVIDGEHYLDAGPSFALDPKNRDNGVIWATGKGENWVNDKIANSDYIFIISGSPQKSKLFNKRVAEITFNRVKKSVGEEGAWDKFKSEVLGVSKIGKINEILNKYNSFEDLLASTDRKELLIQFDAQKEKKGTPLKGLLEKYGAFVDYNDLRDGFFKDNDFKLNDVMLVLKPTGYGGKSAHSTYENDILGEVVGVPDRKVNAYDIMPDEFRAKYAPDMSRTEQSQAVAPYGAGVRNVQASVGNRSEEDLRAEGTGKERPRALASRYGNLNPATQAKIEDDATVYFQRTNKQTKEAVDKFLDGLNIMDAADYVLSNPKIPEVSQVWMAAEVAKRLNAEIDAAGNNQDLIDDLTRKQGDVFNEFAKKATSLGQAVQAFIAFKDNPNAVEFFLPKILRQLKKAGVENVTEEQRAEILTLLKDVNSAAEGLPKDKAIIKLSHYLAGIAPLKPMDVLQSIWYAKILSGITTQSTNFFANIFNTVFELPVVALRISMLNGTPLGMLAGAKGFASGVAKGAVTAADIIKSGVRSKEVDKYFAENPLEYFTWSKWLGNKGKVLDYIPPLNFGAWKYVGRLLAATDAFFATANQEAIANMLAYAEAAGTPAGNNFKKANALLGNNKMSVLRARAQAKAEGFEPGTIQYKRRELEIIAQKRAGTQEADEIGKRITMNYDPEGFTKPLFDAVVGLQENIPAIKMVIPFARIVANLTENGLNYSPFGFAKAVTGIKNPFQGLKSERMNFDQRTDMFYKSMLGMGMLLYILPHVGEDDDDWFEITAGGSTDLQKKYELQKGGWRPYTITLKDGTKISYKDWPTAGLLAGLGHVRDAKKYKIDDSTQTTLFATGFFLNLYDKSLLKGLQDLFGIIPKFNRGSYAPDDRMGERFTKYAAQQVKSVALSNLSQQSFKLYSELVTGDPQRDAKTFAQIIYRDIPSLNDGIRPIIDVFGDEVPYTTKERLLPVMDSPEKEEIIEWLNNNKMFVGVPMRKNIKLLDGTERPMTDDEYYEYRKNAGKAVKKFINEFMSEIKNEQIGKEAFEKVVDAARQQAYGEILMKANNL